MHRMTGEQPPQGPAQFTGWVACRFPAPTGQAAGSVWLRSKAKAVLCLGVAARALSLVVSGTDLLAGCTSLAYTWVPSSATGSSGCLVLEATAHGPAEPGRQDQQPERDLSRMLLVFKFDSAAASGECGKLLQALLPVEPQHAAAAAHTSGPAGDAAQQVTTDYDWIAAQQAIQRYLLDEDFQAYVHKVEDAWDELEANVAVDAL